MQTQNTFLGGLNSDTAKNKFENTKYTHANNIRIITDEGMSSGAVENTKGTKLSFKLPSLPTYTYEQDGQNGAVVIPALNNLVIIGWCTINTKIVLFTKHKAVSKVVYNQIWLLQFDESTDSISGLNNGFLDPSIHLKYNRQLNMSKKVKCFGIEESEKFMRVYWTDTQNDLMGINLLNPNCLNVPQRTLPVNTRVTMNVPFVDELGLGNLPNGTIQYFYRLCTRDGAITNFSPLSNMFALNNGNEEGEWQDYPAISIDRFNDDLEAKEQTRLDESSENGCLVKVTDIDKDYDYIQLGYVLWKAKDAPLFYLLTMQLLQIDPDKSKHFTYYHDGNEIQTSITQGEFNRLVNVWDSCYTMEVKDNTLYTANTTSGQFDVDALIEGQTFDARAYRFLESSRGTTCSIYRADGVEEVNFAFPNFPAPYTEFIWDCINPDSAFHETNPVYVHRSTSYKYNPKYSQSGKYRLGGCGPNIDYIFTNNSMIVDTNVFENYDAPSYNAFGDQAVYLPYQNKKDIKGGVPFTNVPNATGNNIPTMAKGSSTDRTNKSWSDFKNPYLSSKIACHQHGEIYRYWITFYNKKNQASFAKWIADIKTPEFNDSDFATVYKLNDFDVASGTMTVQTMGIEFHVTIPAWLSNEIVGFSIGRTERQEEDKTRLGTGITGRFYNHSVDILSWSTFKSAFIGICTEFIQRIFPNSKGGFFSMAESLAETFIEKITGTLDDINISQLGAFSKKMTEEDLRSFIRISFDSHGDKIKVFGPLVEKLVENISVNLFELIKGKIGWIDEETYSLGGSFGDKRVHPTAIYAIHPAQQFDKYHYKTGDSINVIQKFRLETHGESQAAYTYIQDKFVNVIHRYSNTGLTSRVDSTACVRKWYKGQLDSGTYEIEKEITFDQGDIIKSNFLSDGTTGTFVNSFIGYYEKYSAFNHLFGQEVIDVDKAADLPSYSDREPYWDGLKMASQKLKVFGLGDKKHLLKLNTSFKSINLNTNMLDLESQLCHSADGSAGAHKIINPIVFKPALSGMSAYDPSIIKYIPGKEIMSGEIYEFPIRTQDEYNNGTKGNKGLVTGLIVGGIIGGIVGAIIDNNQDPGSGWNNYYENLNIKKPRCLDVDGDCIISYNRTLNKQYGGASITERNNNTVIEVAYVNTHGYGGIGNYTINPIGDSYVGLYAAINYNYYFEQFGPYHPAERTKKAMVEIFPTEQSFNFNLREGRHTFNSFSTADLDTTEQKIKRQIRRAKRKAKKSGVDEATLTKLILPKRFIFDDFKFDDVYTQERNAKILVPKPIINSFVENVPNRMWKSKPKMNGELIDSFREFKSLDYLDVELSRGPIRDLVNFKGQLVFLQDTGFGVATTNEKSSMASSTGSFTLISSTPLSRYDYISKESGTNQRFSTVITDSFISYFDSNKKKLIKYGEGLEPLTDIHGLSGFFRTEINPEFLTEDDVIYGGYFPEYNTLFYTFNKKIKPFTISYNLLQNSFESFHSYYPDNYLKTNNRLLVSNINEGHSLFDGNRGEYFNKYHSSSITVLTNEHPEVTKTFDNYNIYTEVYDTNGVNLTNETISKIQCKTDYQDTGLIKLQVSNNQLYTDPTNLIKRRERKWSLDIPRSTNSSAYTTLKERMKDNYILSTFVFDNNNNKKFILQDILTTYRTN